MGRSAGLVAAAVLGMSVLAAAPASAKAPFSGCPPNYTLTVATVQFGDSVPAGADNVNHDGLTCIGRTMKDGSFVYFDNVTPPH